MACIPTKSSPHQTWWWANVEIPHEGKSWEFTLSQFTRCTFLAAKNCIPLHICKAADTRLVIVKISSLEKSSLHQVGWNISLLLRRNSSRLPCGQYSIIMYSLGYFVQAPKTFTMFTCSPTWIIIFNSPAKLRMSFALGLSKNEEKISQWVHFVA